MMSKKQNEIALATSLVLAIGASTAVFSAAATQKLAVTELAEGLDHPWGMAFMPTGDILLSERAGNLRTFSFANGLSEPLGGVPKVVASGQGGMLDVAVDPSFADNRKIYFCYSKAGAEGSSSSVASATLNGEAIENVTTLFTAGPLVDNGFHFGCRLTFDGEKNLFITLGDRYKLMKEAQNTDNHLGTIVRIHRDGSVPSDNPFVTGKAPEVFTYGHRNVQGITVHPETGEIWAMEHGPRGGDEINLLNKGDNYGWPVITYGIDYDGDIISNKTHQDGMRQPVIYWDPSIAPSGMTFYHGNVFKAWQGDLLVGSLKFRHLRRIDMDGNTPGEQEEFLRDRNQRIRDVEVGPDGFIYLLTDEGNGKLLQITPAN